MDLPTLPVVVAGISVPTGMALARYAGPIWKWLTGVRATNATAAATVRVAEINADSTGRIEILRLQNARIDALEKRIDECTQKHADCERRIADVVRSTEPFLERLGDMDAIYRDTQRRAEECERDRVEDRKRIATLEDDLRILRRSLTPPSGMPQQKP